MAKNLLGFALVLTALVAFPSSASAEDTRCVGQLIGTFDNVTVPENAECILFASMVRATSRPSAARASRRVSTRSTGTSRPFADRAFLRVATKSPATSRAKLPAESALRATESAATSPSLAPPAPVSGCCR
jgi:hypothetical protein